MATNTVEAETMFDREILNELIHWVKTLNSVGVSPDKAAEVARDFLAAACLSSHGYEELDEDEEYDEDDE